MTARVDLPAEEALRDESERLREERAYRALHPQAWWIDR